MKKIQLTRHEWQEAMKVSLPHRNRKKYYRKEKHRGTRNSASYLVTQDIIRIFTT